MATVEHSSVIHGVDVVALETRADDRGDFTETYRDEWFPGRPPMVQSNRSVSRAGVVRGLHYHLRQADYWTAGAGRLLVALHDLRASSTTRGRSLTMELGGGVYIPPGVAHGFLALTDVTLNYLVDRYYDAADEHGVAWDDPALGIDWPVGEKIVSLRDRSNPKLADIPRERIPG